MKLEVVFAGSVSKDYPEHGVNEDHYAYDIHRQRFSISDGAGQSYAPALWSHILTHEFVRGHGIVCKARKRLLDSITKFERECQPERLSWSRAAAYKLGTFATLIGIELKGDRLSAVALGDSLLVVTDAQELKSGDRRGCDRRLVSSFPYDDAEAFDEHPLLLSTRDAANHCFDRNAVSDRMRHWRISVGSRIFLMTDSMGHWLLSRHADETAREELSAIRCNSEFSDFVVRHRRDRSLKLDDCTLIHLIAKESTRD
jgi:hypothetical protein